MRPMGDKWTTRRELPNTYPVSFKGRDYNCLHITDANGELTVTPGGYPGTAKRRSEVKALLGIPRKKATVVIDGVPKSVRNLSMYEEEKTNRANDELACIVVIWEE